MTQPNMGIGFEPIMDQDGNLFVGVHCRLGMLAASMTIPEAMLPEFIDGLRNTLADARQMKSQARKVNRNLLGPDGQPVKMPFVITEKELDAMSSEKREDLRQQVLEAAQVQD